MKEVNWQYVWEIAVLAAALMGSYLFSSAWLFGVALVCIILMHEGD